jgi:hypothetical protein
MGSKMRAGSILIILIMISTSAFADDRSQTNVYDEFRHLGAPSPNVTVDEQVTALIKRSMANLLYPVDMSSLVSPDKDTKFRDQIIVLQQQMGVALTGVLTADEFDRLSEASRNVDSQSISLPPKTVFMLKDQGLVLAGGAKSWDDDANPNRFYAVRVSCVRASGTCEEYEATYNLDTRVLLLDVAIEYRINTWTSSEVTAQAKGPCETAFMTIDIGSQQVTTVIVPQPGSSTCQGFQPPDRTTKWKLMNGLSIGQKLSQDKMSKARMLVYPPARKFMQ